MAEFTLARVRADLESVKLVELYRKEGLLEGASVPRFRMPDVTIDMPLLVSDLENAESASSFKRPTTEEIRASIREAAASTNFAVDAELESELVKQVDSDFETSWKAPQALDKAMLLTRDISLKLDPLVKRQFLSRARIPGALPTAALDPTRLREADPATSAELDTGAKTFLRSVELRLKTTAIGSIGQGPRLNMSAKTSEVREAGDSSLVARVSMTFKEDGFEVVSVDRGDGSTQVRLVPE